MGGPGLCGLLIVEYGFGIQTLGVVVELFSRCARRVCPVLFQLLQVLACDFCSTVAATSRDYSHVA